MPLVGDWWARGSEPLLAGDEAQVGTADVADSAITTAKLAALNVTSEKISANALQRSVIAQLPDLAAAATLSSAFVVWTPKTAVQINGFSLIPMTSWVQTTVQTTPVGTLYAGAGAAIGTVNIPTTDAPVGGIALAGTVAAAYSVAAGQAVSFGLTAATSAGMNAPAHALQIDYLSTA